MMADDWAELPVAQLHEEYYYELIEKLRELADELDNARIPQQPTHTEVKRQVRTLAAKLRELAGIDTRK